METLTRGEVAQQAQVRLETLRYYERLGLLVAPPRNEANYRMYPPETVRQVRFIKRAQQLGFSLKEITELLALRALPETLCGDIRARAIAKINALDAKIRALRAIKDVLTALIAVCPEQEEVIACPILTALDVEGHI